MTGYVLSCGYCSSFPTKDRWGALKEIVDSITHTELVKEYYKGGGQTTCEDGCCKAEEFADWMTTKRGHDLSLRVVETKQQYTMLASGGDPGRTMKENMRRAFIRLVLEKAHKIQLEVNVNVH